MSVGNTTKKAHKVHVKAQAMQVVLGSLGTWSGVVGCAGCLRLLSTSNGGMIPAVEACKHSSMNE